LTPRKSGSPNGSALASLAQSDSFQVEWPLDGEGFGFERLEIRFEPVLALAAIVPLNALPGAINFC
jgi:hypothetical protein